MFTPPQGMHSTVGHGGSLLNGGDALRPLHVPKVGGIQVPWHYILTLPEYHAAAELDGLADADPPSWVEGAMGIGMAASGVTVRVPSGGVSHVGGQPRPEAGECPVSRGGYEVLE